MEPLGTVARVAARVGEPITEASDIALAQEMLEEASAQVRLYGLPWVDPATAPAIAVTTAIAAAARGYQNPSGLKMERGDAVTLDVDVDYRKGAALTAGEIRMIQMAANTRSRVTSIPLSNPDRFVATSDTGLRSVGSPEHLYLDARPYPW
jgi:hypothetical protein